MALLERVSMLIRANLNDLIDKSEDPEKMIKQVILDMQNQLMQVKTQVAIAIADQHLLEKKQKENESAAGEWLHKAEFAVEKQQDDLARAAIDRSMSYKGMGENYAQQVIDQHAQVEELKSALFKLEKKLVEAQTKADLLIAQSRRARTLAKATDARTANGNGHAAATFDRLKDRSQRDEAIAQAKVELLGESVEDRFAALEKTEKIEKLLSEIKQRKQLGDGKQQLASD
jgi:phage shock protein A